jgi:hypothetical protein
MRTALVSFFLLAASAMPARADGTEFTLEYVRPAGDKFVPESTVRFQKTAAGFLFRSVTQRPAEKMTLTLRTDSGHVPQVAELEQETAAGKHTATAIFNNKTVVVKRPGQLDQQLTLAADPVLATTAPDWSDILLVLRRYDFKQGGKQQFAGLWFHPVKPPLALTFTVEALGQDTIPAGDKKLTLGRYRVQLRSGAYLVWADSAGKVFKLLPPGQPRGAVILKGQEKSTAGLTGQ